MPTTVAAVVGHRINATNTVPLLAYFFIEIQKSEKKMMAITHTDNALTKVFATLPCMHVLNLHYASLH
jgi:hypothetical protein